MPMPGYALVVTTDRRCETPRSLDPTALPPTADGVVLLRPWTDGDVSVIAEACRDPEIARWIDDIPAPYTRADARAYVAACRRGWKDGSLWAFAVTDAATGEVLGSCGVGWQDHPHGVAEIGYWVRRRGSRSRRRHARGAARRRLGVRPGRTSSDCSCARTCTTSRRSAWRRRPASSARACCGRVRYSRRQQTARRLRHVLAAGGRGRARRRTRLREHRNARSSGSLRSAALSDATRRAYRVRPRAFAAWLDERGLRPRRRRRARADRVRGRARPRTAAAARPGDDRAQARRRSRAAPLTRSVQRACPTSRSRRDDRGACRTSRKADEVDRELTVARRRRPDPAAQPRARRARLLGRPAQRRRRSGSISSDVDFEQEAVRVLRQGRQGARRAAGRGGGSLARALPPRRPAAARARRRERALRLGARPPPRHEHAAARHPRTRTACVTRSPRTSSRAAPTCA